MRELPHETKFGIIREYVSYSFAYRACFLNDAMVLALVCRSYSAEVHRTLLECFAPLSGGVAEGRECGIVKPDNPNSVERTRHSPSYSEVSGTMSVTIHIHSMLDSLNRS